MIAYVIFENNSRKNKDFLRKSEKSVTWLKALRGCASFFAVQLPVDRFQSGLS
jgi:hypothetical protein